MELRGEKNKEKIKFMEAAYPLLEDGEYTVTVSQTVESPVKETFDSASMGIRVGYPHFSLAAGDVDSVYPAPGSTGNYGNTLPHITLCKKTLPWERTADGHTPWLALLCLREDEIAAQKQMTIQELLDTCKTEQNIFFPTDYNFTLASEKGEDPCTVIDLSKDYFTSLMPGLLEVPYLCHIKDVDMYDKEDKLIGFDGLYSVVAANRFVPSAKGKPVKCGIYLVSLEGYWDYLKGGNSFGKLPKEYTRLAVLYRFEVLSKVSEQIGFREALETIDSGAMSARSEDSQILKRGYVPKLHITRTGEKTVSCYRGPFVPYNTAADEKPDFSGSMTADGCAIYDPEIGVFDMSYAAAWQIGRLLTLGNRPVASDIFRWRRNIQRTYCGEENERILKMHRDTFTEEKFLDFFFHELYPKLAKGELAAPVAGDRRKR